MKPDLDSCYKLHNAKLIAELLLMCVLLVLMLINLCHCVFDICKSGAASVGMLTFLSVLPTQVLQLIQSLLN